MVVAPNQLPREEFFGPWTTEEEAAAEFDRRIEASGCFKSFAEVSGFYMAHRPGRQGKDARIDRILEPLAKLQNLGWRSPIGVEIKASGTKLGPALAQAIDYTWVSFNRADHWYFLDHVFLWPLPQQKGAVESVMVQNRVGAIYEQSSASLIFQLEKQVIRIGHDGDVKVQSSTSGTKVGSR